MNRKGESDAEMGGGKGERDLGSCLLSTAHARAKDRLDAV